MENIIVLDAGHGGSDPGCSGNGYVESQLTLKVVSSLASILKVKAPSLKVVLTRSDNNYVSLRNRTDYANRFLKNDAKVRFLSVHFNSADSSTAHGFESFVQINYDIGATKQFRQRIHNRIKPVLVSYNITDRGMRTSNLHVCRETRMPAVLLEILFLSSREDSEVLKTNYLSDIINAIAEAIMEEFGLKSTIDQVVVNNSSDSPHNVEVKQMRGKGLVRLLKGGTLNVRSSPSNSAGISSVLQPNQIVDIVGYTDKWFKISSGGFIYRDYVSLGTTLIMGKSLLSKEVLVAYLLRKNSAPRLTVEPIELVNLFLDVGDKEGVRGDIAFIQACHETGFFRYGGIVNWDQNNFCGLGALNNNSKGQCAAFKTAKEGVTAQIQHLKAYASLEKPNLSVVDPRYDLVTKGVAHTVESLAGKWAVPGYPNSFSSLESAFTEGKTYGQIIMNYYEEAKKYQSELNQASRSQSTQIKTTTSKTPRDLWYAEAMDFVISNGISSSERPNDPVTRAEAWTMIQRACQYIMRGDSNGKR